MACCPTYELWSLEDAIKLRELWNKGQSAKDIAKVLGKSKNGVIGKAFRLGLRAHAHAKIKTGKPLVKEQKKFKGRSRQADQYNTAFASKVDLQPSAKKTSRPQPVLVKNKPISLIDLKANQCRFPYGENNFLFCGGTQQEKSSYCAAHHWLCYSQNRRGSDDTQ